MFVYGTLKRNEYRGSLIESYGGKLVGEATLPSTRMFHLGAFPAVVADVESGYDVRGELWLVDEDTLAILDSIEGTPSLYQRYQHDVLLDADDRLVSKVYVYVWADGLDGLRGRYTELTTGLW